MTRFFSLWIWLFLFTATACVPESGTGVEASSHEQLTPEALVEQAQPERPARRHHPVTPEALVEQAAAKYDEYLAANEGDRVAATNKTAEYLRGLAGVKEVRVRGSDTLFVIMKDGKELLLMLGKNRL